MSQHILKRIIGSFEGQTPGPLIIAIGALHGNEPAGVLALESVLEALESERRDHADFKFNGKLLGVIGNAQAFLLRQRFLEQDLNRSWVDDMLASVQSGPIENLSAEAREIAEIIRLLREECQAFLGQQIVFLDLHTTSAEGGIFSIPTDEADSLDLARHLGAPAILGLQENISGTLLGYAKAGGFFVSPASSDPLCIAFEAGQHQSPHSVARAAIAVVRCLRASGCIEPEAMNEFLDRLSLPALATIPPVVRFRYAHHIEAEDRFKMRPGYVNFQPIVAGEHLADDVRGPVLSPENGLILMPLYQAKGSDGFFIVR